MRPLPVVSNRSLGTGPAYFVDPVNGNNSNSGSQSSPWKTINYAKTSLQPGYTLYLRGGIYYEHVILSMLGTETKPITIRSYPGELAIIDGGIREFFENAAAAWVPYAGGAPGEYISAATYPGIGTSGSFGNFADSMVPLHRYKYLIDLRSDNSSWDNLTGGSDTVNGIYNGPGIYYDAVTDRIHIRLAHTNWNFLPEDRRYLGEQDPRNLPLIIGSSDQLPLYINNAQNIDIQDLVVRGPGRYTVEVRGSRNINFDHVTIYGGGLALRLHSTNGFRFTNSALRGISAPWSFRTSHKYRGNPAYLFFPPSSVPQSSNFEFAYSEFTDSHDCFWAGGVIQLSFHNNLLDNCNDDGLIISGDNSVTGGPNYFYQNYLSRALNMFVFVGTQDKNYIYRNIIDLRPPVQYYPGSSAMAGDPPRIITTGMIANDHGTYIWNPIFFYHNTFFRQNDGWRDYYFDGWGRETENTIRRIFNNIDVQIKELPGFNFHFNAESTYKWGQIPASADIQINGNLYWGVQDGPGFQGQYFPSNWAAIAPLDLFANPRFVNLYTDWRQMSDLRLQSTSPLINAGGSIPPEWPDPFRAIDQDSPDIGAIPFNAPDWKVGIDGRLIISQQSSQPTPTETPTGPTGTPTPTPGTGIPTPTPKPGMCTYWKN